MKGRGLLLPLAAGIQGWNGLLVIAGVGVAATLAVGSAGATGRSSAEATGPAVVFQEGRYVYAIALDGSRRVRLAALPLDWSDPAVSPDGSRIAYEREGGISVMRVDGTQRRVVTRGRDSGPAWAPDGRTLYFSRTEGRPGGRRPGEPLYSGSIFSVPITGGKARRITDATKTGHCHSEPAISPDGRRIAFSEWTACEGGTAYPRLRVVDRNGQPTADLRVLTGNRSDQWRLEYANPEWSPDGRRIAFRRNSDLVIANRDGSGLRRVVQRGFASIWEGPRWSPDGVWIASDRYSSERYALFVVHPDGTGFRKLYTGTDLESLAGWLPRLPK